MMKRLWGIGVFSATVLLSGAAWADDVPYSADLGTNEHLTGTAEQDDSSGDMVSLRGVAAGPVAGSFTLDRVNAHAVLDGPGLKLHVDFDKGDQSVYAHLDSCASPDKCDAGNKVLLWEK